MGECTLICESEKVLTRFLTIIFRDGFLKEAFLPLPRGEIGSRKSWLVYPLTEIKQIVEWMNAMNLCSTKERIENGKGVGSLWR